MEVEVNLTIKKLSKIYGPFSWKGFNCTKTTEPLRGGSLLFTNLITSNNFRNSLADLRAEYSHPQWGTFYGSPFITSIIQCSQAAPSFSFHLFIQLPQVPAGKECFSVISVFTRICFGFLNKTFRFFPMAFNGNLTHFIPVTKVSGRSRIVNIVIFFETCRDVLVKF